MIERIVFEGNAGDDITNVIPVAINKAMLTGGCCYIHWNGAFVKVYANDNEDSVLNRYYKSLENVKVVDAKNSGDIVYKHELADKLSNYIVEFLNKL